MRGQEVNFPISHFLKSLAHAMVVDFSQREFQEKLNKLESENENEGGSM